MLRRDLPPRLAPVFRVATALETGVTRSRLRAGDLSQPFHGVRAAVREASRGADETRRRALEYAPRLGPAAFLVGATAAAFWDVEVPTWVFDDPLVHVAIPAPGRAPRGAGVRGRSLSSDLARSVKHPRWGVRVASPATTWAQLAPLLPDVRDLVAAGDFFVRDLAWSERPPLATIEQLAAAVAAGRREGGSALREALPLVRTNSASRPEVWVRLILAAAGVPDPELNTDAFDDLGRWLGCPDLAWPRRRVAVEYEGEHHLTDPGQWAKDIARYERFAAAGWRVLRVTKSDVFGDPTRLVARVRAALAAG